MDETKRSAVERGANQIGDETRPPSALDQRCDQYVRDLANINPIVAQDWGIGEGAGRLPDYSPVGIAAEISLGHDLRRWANEPANRRHFDEVDVITAAALEDRFSLDQELYDAGEFERTLNNLASPLQEVRDSFDQLPRRIKSDWSQICDQSAAVPLALEQFQESLAIAASRGQVAARRQVMIAIDQSRSVAGNGQPGSPFKELAEEGTALGQNEAALTKATEKAAAAYGRLADWMEQELLPIAPEQDAVGRDRYQRLSRLFVGATIDLDETYEWGLHELERIERQQREIAASLYGPDTTVREALERLNADPALTLHGSAELQSWMQETADRAITQLADAEFDIPAELRVIECMLAPSSSGGIYYTAPSADFSRPGRMWWSVPDGVTEFHAWQERTTIFHEGVPGHHLQIGLAMTGAAVPNLWRRLASWNSGYGEGWALYAENLMVELGYQSELPDLMGVLDAQRLRAARVVLDIGVHLQKPKPNGEGPWDADYAEEFLAENVAMSDSFRAFELDRYLGWPGQAPSYKVGQRLWEELRTDYMQTKPGVAPESARKDFHMNALTLGSLPMETLRDALLGAES